MTLLLLDGSAKCSRGRRSARYNPAVSDSSRVTELLQAWSEGDEAALHELVPKVEAELRRLARLYMARERKNHTLQTSALVNEAYLRLVGSPRLRWQNRSHFFGIAARLMRRVLVDHARRRAFQKRGGAATLVTLDDGTLATGNRLDILALDTALQSLASVDARKSRVVEMRFFGGMSVDETAEALHVSADTVKREWRLARLWLTREMAGPARPSTG
jgi:RNA polymerase sigma factor (TIGR02999 family)